MPLTEFFNEQLRELRMFMEQPKQVVRIIRVDPEMRTVLLKMLIGLDAREDFPHLLIGYDRPFADPLSWFCGMQEALEGQCLTHAAALESAGIGLANPAENRSKAPWAFLRYAEGFTDALPDNVGALVFVVEPERVDDPAAFTRSIAFLAERVRSPWLKFLVLDERLNPRLDRLAADPPKIGSQTFWCSPQELENRVDAALARRRQPSSTAEGRRLLAMAAAIASANRDYAKAEMLQRQVLDAARSGGTPAEQALAAYGLGNTLLAAGQAEPAAENLMRACDICCEHGPSELAPIVFTNFGVALHRLGNFDQAFAALRVGSEFFRAQGNRPGEAFVCDTLARIHQELGRPAEAAGVWRYALSLYEGIANPAMADVREAGRSDILAKLARLEGPAGAA
jgi:tetratricopeptide (TPR) repeat protein